MAKTRFSAGLRLTTCLAAALAALSAIGVSAAVGVGWLVRGEMAVASASRYGPYNVRVDGIELVDLRRGTTGQLVARVVNSSYTPSPDHRYLAYVVTDGIRQRCEVRDLTDVMTVIFSSDPAESCAIPIWSVDSERLVAVADRDNSWKVTVFDRESRRARSVLLNDAPFIWTTSASPDGRRVAFVSRYGDPLSVWLLDTVTLDLTLLETPGTQDDFQDIRGNDWSPDGRWLVVMADYAGYSLLFVLDTVGATMRLVDESEVAYGPVSWSPGGQALVFATMSEPPGNGPPQTRLMMLSPASAEVTSLWQSARRVWLTSWTSDGRYLAAANGGTAFDLRVFDTQGRQWRTLVEDSAGFSGHVWSPDDRFLLFNSGHNAMSAFSLLDTSNGAVMEIMATPDDLFTMGWSPDSRFLYIVTGQHNASGLLRVYDVPDGLLREVTIPLPDLSLVQWSPDGRRMVLVASKAGNYERFIVSLNDLSVIPIATPLPMSMEFTAAWSADGERYLTMSYTNNNGILRGDIYLTDLSRAESYRITGTPWDEAQPLWVR